jgi:TolB-like protein
VDSVLEGTIQRVGDRMRVTARLVGVQDGAQLWSRTLDKNFTDIFAARDLISENVAAAL